MPKSHKAIKAECQNYSVTNVTQLWYEWAMTVIAIANQKGGTAKTTTAAALGVLLSRAGFATHLVDMDPQASLSLAFGQNDENGLLFESLRRRTQLPVVRLNEHLTLSVANIELLRAETEFLSQAAREFVLKAALQKTSLSSGGLVILDSPPSLGVLSIACLAAADVLCIVVQPGGFELHTLVPLQQTVDVLKQHVNPQLATIGVVLTNCHRRRKITEQVTRELSKRYEILGNIRADARLLYATTAGAIDKLYRSAALDDYQHVVANLIERLPWPNKSPE